MRWVKIAVLLLFFASLIFQPAVAQEGRRIAYINVSKVFDSYYETKEAEEKLQKEAEKKNGERDKLVDKINKLKDETALLSEEAREKKSVELNREMRALQDFDRETRLSLQRKRDDMMKKIFKKINNAIEGYGRQSDYDIILDDRVLIYANETIDITDEIIEVLNKGR